MRRFYALAPRPFITEGDFSFWGLPPGTKGSVDLSASDSNDRVFITSDQPFNPAEVEVQFGDGEWLNTYVLTAVERSAWETLLGVTLSGSGTLLDVLWSTLTEQADPEGGERAKPLMPSHRGFVSLYLGLHGMVRGVRLPRDPTKMLGWDRIQAVKQGAYRSDYHRDPILARKWLGNEQRRFRLTPEVARDLIVPVGLPRELPLPPTTTIGDTFVEASDTALGSHTATGGDGGYSWTVLAGGLTVIAADNALNGGAAANSRARAESALASDDMLAEIDVTNGTNGGAENMGVPVRYASGADTCYVMLHQTRTDNTYRLFRVTTGSFAQIGTSVETTPPTATYRIGTKIDADSLSGLVDDAVVIGPETDTNITEGKRAGVLMGLESAWRNDNFEAADLAAATGSTSLTLMGVG